MKTLNLSVLALAVAAGGAQAGGIDRILNPYGVLFEEGNYVELSFTSLSPQVSGTYPAAAGGGSTGDMAEDSTYLSFAYKHQFTDQFSLALFQNQPYGALADYGLGFYTGLEATWISDQTALVGRYKFDSNWSVHGGLRYVNSNANITIPDQLNRAGFQSAANQLNSVPASALNAAQTAQLAQLNAALAAPAGALTYTATGTDYDAQVGYILGVAYERPEIGLRVALTYESEITHEIATQETWAGPFALTGGTFNGTTEIIIPQSIKLDFQSGVAQNTLVFGYLRWSEWSKWSVAPQGYFGVTGSEITGFDNDVMTYQLGVAHRFNDTLAMFGRVTYEKANGGIASRLSPTDGSTSYGFGVRLSHENVNVTAGVEYAKLGDAVDSSGTVFEGNDLVGFGVTVGVRF